MAQGLSKQSLEQTMTVTHPLKGWTGLEGQMKGKTNSLPFHPDEEGSVKHNLPFSLPGTVCFALEKKPVSS